MMMSTIIANNWGDPSVNLSLLEPGSPFPDEMRSVYGTSLLSPPPPINVHEAVSEDFMTFSNSSIEPFPSGELEGNGSGMGFGNESNGTVFTNFGVEPGEYIFDRSDVRAILLVLYTIVFCSCFFGNLMVILVVTLHWRMRSITNFCLANLAFADLCVGIFCVYQNISTYLMDSWIFGEFMCKMYHFINSMSTTASVLILVVICIERYLAIIHPMTCKQMLTLNRLRITIVLVWILSAAFSSPRFYYIDTLAMPLPNNQYEILCRANRLLYDSKLLDMVSMTVLFLIPLAIISFLYTHIGIVLWKSSNPKMASATPSAESSSSSGGYYRETDNNILQAVNLTLLPVSEQQLQARPTTLCGVPTNFTPSPPQVEKRSASSSSILPSPFVCLKCRNKARKQHQRKSTKRQAHSCRLVNGNGIAVSANKYGGEQSLTCKVCQYPFNHYHHSNGHLGSYESGEAMTTSFIDCPCHTHNQQHHNHNHVNIEDSPVPLPNKDNGGSRDDATSSPMAATCCGAGKGAKCLRLRKLGSQDEKMVTFSENLPPSPFCSKSCSCLDGKTDPIVLVKFEKRKSLSKGRKGGNGSRRSQCAILMMNTKPYREHNREGEAAKWTGNGKVCGVDPAGEMNECRDSPTTTISPSPPKFDCGICHPPGPPAPKFGIECGDEGNMSDCPVIASGRGGMHNCSHKNFSFEHTKNLSLDSGIAGMHSTQLGQSSSPGRSIIVGGSCDQNLDGYSIGSGIATGTCTASCPTCGASCGESYQVTRRNLNQLQHPHNSHYIPPSSPKLLPNGSAPLPGVPPMAQSGPPKRLRRMRIVRSSKYGSGALQSRRRIIRMLIVVVLTFALCHAPVHLRKVWQYYSPKWAENHAGSAFSTLLTPITFLIMYANSSINPILYAFFSKKFRMSFRDLLCCKMRHSLRISRNASVRSTHAVALSQAGL